MQETMRLQLSRETLRAVQANTLEKVRLLHSELQNHESAVKNFIVSYHFKERLWIYDVEIDPGSIVMNTGGEGCFCVQYKLGAFDTTESVVQEKSVQMKINLNIDFVTERILLTSEDLSL